MQGLAGWMYSHAQSGETDPSSWLPQAAAAPECGTGCGLSAWSRHVGVARLGELIAAVGGRPRFSGSALPHGSPAQILLTLWQRHGPAMMQHIHGSFALAIVDGHRHQAFLAIDRIGSHSLAFAERPAGLFFADRADTVAAHPAVGRNLDDQGLFNYFYFYDVPAPGSIFRGVEKLLPGQCLHWRGGKAERSFYWRLPYRDEARHDFAEQSARFHRILRESVGRARGDAEQDGDVAAFLSGGTDSSTVCGVLTELAGKPARTYSIGFEADGFDEMEYARLAAKRFGLDAQEYYLKPADILTAIPIIAHHYDEPFANESAVPTLFCARLAAADGYKVMLAGDGGDEIFGGNARYAKQKIFEAYHALPAPLRRGLIEPLAHLPGLDALAPARKLQSYIRQANIPLPERMESYNFIYRQPLAEMFPQDLLDRIDAHLPAAWLKDAYDRADSASYINRMMHLDLKFTLADNDLRKVNGMTEAAGIEVRYPLLDDEMVAFSGQVPPDWKVKGQYLRWFFKTALKGFLPDEIINKSKHGFGLPFGVWARDYAPLRERIEDRLSDFRKRNLLNPAYVDHVRNEHMTGHATYFGKMLWVILTLEEWLEAKGMGG